MEAIKRFSFHQEQLECHALKHEYIPPQAVQVITARINSDSWSEKDKIKAIGATVCTHSEDIEQIPVGNITCPFTYDVVGLQGGVHVVIDNSMNLSPLHIQKDKLIAHAEFLLEQVPQEEIRQILESSDILIKEDGIGELEKQAEEDVHRFDYIDKVDIKAEEPDTKEFCKTLLRDTEPLGAKHPFDIGKFDQKARVTIRAVRRRLIFLIYGTKTAPFLRDHLGADVFPQAP